jgi:hypothetical protein
LIRTRRHYATKVSVRNGRSVVSIRRYFGENADIRIMSNGDQHALKCAARYAGVSALGR